jgi:hypothetical protein
MKETGIPFSAPMVRAILAGEKSQTRRAVKFRDGAAEAIESLRGVQPYPDGSTRVVFETSDEGFSVRSRYGGPGDRLWVRESIRIGRIHPRLDGGEQMVEYVADGAEHPDANWPWKRGVLPSIFMPRGISRITLEVVSVRVERVQDISDEDIAAEGVTPEAVRALVGDGTKDPRGLIDVPVSELSLRECWRLGWCAINGVESWDANPWVWAIEFRRVTP